MSGNPVISAVDVFALPLWLLVLLVFVLIPSAALLGYRTGRHTYSLQKDLSSDKKAQPSDTSIGAFLALLGLLLAFTYSFALSRFDDRKDALLLEANALGTAFVQAMLLEEPKRTDYREAILAYAETRSFGTAMNRDGTPLGDLLNVSLERQAALTDALETVLASDVEAAIRNSMTGSLTDILDAHTIRVEAQADSIPQALKYLLAMVAAFAVFMVGHDAGIRGKPLTWRVLAFSGLLIIVLVQIFDFERPASGIIRVPETIMLITIEDMRSELAVEQSSLQ